MHFNCEVALVSMASSVHVCMCSECNFPDFFSKKTDKGAISLAVWFVPRLSMDGHTYRRTERKTDTDKEMFSGL